MAKGYCAFSNGIYPRRLYVAVGLSEDDVNRMFISERGMLTLDWEGSDAATFDEIRDRDTLTYGSLVVFRSKGEMAPGTMAHEAVHVMESYMDVLGIERTERGTNEHLSYLLGWIVKCMDEVKKGRVKPVTPGVKNKKNINDKRKDKK